MKKTKINDDVRTFAKHNGVLLWQVAEALHIADTTFSKELRHELPPDRKEKIYEAIKTIAAEG